MKEFGTIGKAKGFAVFPDYETGRRAEFLLLKTAKYQEFTLNQAIEAWAPEEDHNNTKRYQRDVHDWTQFDMNRKVKSLSKKELEIFVNALERKEGAGKGKSLNFLHLKRRSKLPAFEKIRMARSPLTTLKTWAGFRKPKESHWPERKRSILWSPLHAPDIYF